MTLEPFLKNQVCVVTGASRGIGREITLALARHGADVVINYLRNEKAARETAEAVEALGRKSLLCRADVSTMEGARRLIEDAATHFVRIDVLINNVGPFAMAAIAETSVEEWQRLLAGNLHGGFYCAKYVLPILRRQGGGHIIFIGSPKANSTRARQNVAAYGIAKTGVVLLAKTLAREEGPNGIRANVINPGIIDTGRLSDEEREDFIRQIPLRRLGTPADVAGAVLFLLSPLGEYCNGCTLNVDGGLWL